MPVKQVKISEVLSLLKNGYTRLEKDATDPQKSIESYYQLSAADAKTLFSHARVKGVKTHFITMEIIDDVTDESTIVITDDTTPALASEAFQAQLDSVVAPANHRTPSSRVPAPQRETVDVFA